MNGKPDPTSPRLMVVVTRLGPVAFELSAPCTLQQMVSAMLLVRLAVPAALRPARPAWSSRPAVPDLTSEGRAARGRPVTAGLAVLPGPGPAQGRTCRSPSGFRCQSATCGRAAPDRSYSVRERHANVPETEV